MKVIYLDVLIVINLVISISFLSLTKKMTYSYSTVSSMILASIIGSMSSMVILINNTYIGIALKVVILLLQVSICFKTVSIRKIISLSFIYFIINIIYSGLCIIMWNILDNKIFYVKNMTVYFDIDIGTLIGIVIAIYIIISLFELLSGNRFDKFKKYKVEFTISGEKYSLSGIADTGNSLVDYYYSKSVVIVMSNTIYNKLVLSDHNCVFDNKLHILPYNTVHEEALIYVTKPMKIYISDYKTFKNCEVCIGISKQINEKEKCIFNPKILF